MRLGKGTGAGGGAMSALSETLRPDDLGELAGGALRRGFQPRWELRPGR